MIFLFCMPAGWVCTKKLIKILLFANCLGMKESDCDVSQSRDFRMPVWLSTTKEMALTFEFRQRVVLNLKQRHDFYTGITWEINKTAILLFSSREEKVTRYLQD